MRLLLLLFCSLPTCFGQTILTESTRLDSLHRASDLGYSSGDDNYSQVFGGDNSIRSISQADRFGADVSLVGSSLLIGAPGHSSALLFQRSIASGLWIFDEILHTRGTGVNFGASVSIGPDYFLVGQPDYRLANNLIHGSAFFGDRDDITRELFYRTRQDGRTSWTAGHPNLGFPADGNMLGKLDDDPRFGQAVDHDGSTAVVGSFFQTNSTGDRTGAAYIFDISNTTIGRVGDSVDAEDDAIALVPTEPAQEGSFYGSDVAIDGDLAVVGWQGFDSQSNTSIGRAVVFQKNQAGAWNPIQSLSGSGTSNSRFGEAVDILGTTVAVGEAGPAFSNSLGDYMAGRVDLFDATTGNWLQTLTPPNDAMRFGSSVSLYEDLLVIGAPGNRNDVLPRAFAYRRDANGTYLLVNGLEPTTNSVNTEFGISVSAGTAGIAIGAPDEDITSAGAGGVYLYNASSIANIATITLTDRSKIYNGEPQSVTVTTDPPNLGFTITYDGSPDAPTNAGSYQVEATISEPGYAQISAQTTLEINKASQTISLASFPFLEVLSPNQPIIATTSDGLREDEILLSIADTKIATVAGDELDPRAAGNTTLRASLPVSPNFNFVLPQSVSVIVENPNVVPSTGGDPVTTNPGEIGISSQLGYRTAIRGDYAAAVTGTGGLRYLVVYRRDHTGKFAPMQNFFIPGTAEDLDLEGDRMVVGIPSQNLVVVYQRTGAQWSELTQIQGSAGLGQFGRTVNLSRDSRFLHIAYFTHTGDPNTEGGARVRSYEWDGQNYVLRQTLQGGTANQVTFGSAIDDITTSS